MRRFLIIYSQPIAHVLPASLESLTQPLLLLRFQKRFDPIFAARKDPFGFPKVERAQIG